MGEFVVVLKVLVVWVDLLWWMGFTMVFRGKRIVIPPELIFKVLCVPRVDLLDYPSHRHFSTISRDELASLFYEKAMLCGGTPNFSTSKFAKGP